MRSVGLLAVLLLVMACKPISRGPGPDYDVSAIGNDTLTLGMVPVRNNSGVHAYRLLVCRKSASYPKWMLEDSNRCRPALLDQDSSEVVFLQDDLERDFATKYVGYAKGFILPALIGAGAVTIGASAARTGAGAGKWVIEKGFDTAKGGWGWVRSTFDTVSERLVRIVPKRFKDRNIGAAGIIKYRAAYESALRQLEIAESTNKVLPKELGMSMDGMQRSFKHHASEFAAALKVRNLEVEQSSLRKLEKMSEGKYADHITSLKERNQKILDNGLNLDKMETLRVAAEGGNRNSWEPYLAKIDDLNEFNRNKFVIDQYDKAENMDFAKTRLDFIGNHITTARESLEKVKASKEHTLLAGMPVSKIPTMRWGAAGGVAAATGLGAAAVTTATDTITSATQTLIALDKSLWGYADRQTSMYWSQVFREGGMQDAKQVQDLRAVLGAFAETFGYKVNEDAFALGG